MADEEDDDERGGARSPGPDEDGDGEGGEGAEGEGAEGDGDGDGEEGGVIGSTPATSEADRLFAEELDTISDSQLAVRPRCACGPL